MIAPMTIAPRTQAPAGARMTVDLSALAANWRTLAGAAGPAETAAAVKADAYGTGLEAAAGALWQAGCRTFFVALPAEGAALRAALPAARIFVLNGFLRGSGAFYRNLALSPVLGDPGEVDDWLAEAGDDGPGPAIHVDTGLNRLGLHPDEAAALAADPSRLARLRPALVMSHFACADLPDHPLTTAQMQRFQQVRRMFPGLPGSLANSAGVALGPEARHDLVRPGISLYGGRSRASGDHPVRPVVTIEARVVQVREVAAGDSVGYGATARLSRPARVAILSAGYADGLPRCLGTSGGSAAFRGKRLPLIGRVSMDLLAVDVSDPGGSLIERGDWVELIGPTVPLSEVAEIAGTVDYEILTGLGRRFERVHAG
jgi:alanine racemase